MPKQPIINCHTHIFTGDSVPPWLAKTFLPFPFYYLLPLSGVVKLLRFWYDYPYRIQFTPGYKKIQRRLYKTRMLLQRVFLFDLIKILGGIFLTVNIFFFFYDWISSINSSASAPPVNSKVLKMRDWLLHYHILRSYGIFANCIFIFLLLLFFPVGRNLIIFLLKFFFKFLQILPGKQTGELIKRYILIGRFSRYKTQSGIFSKLSAQYPPGTGIVVLPMDMEYMGAGFLKKDYRLEHQLHELAELKKSHPKVFFPFVAADPRRIKEDPSYFSYSIGNPGEVILDPDCLVKKCIVDDGFSGVKIYPALGYFPFDEDLLALFKYTADMGLPITTHCIKGSIFYRGSKQKAWDTHPVFLQSMGKDKSHTDLVSDDEPEDHATTYCGMLLPETNNVDFQANFTHPLNFLCLLNEELLREIIGISPNEKLKTLFGYNGKKKPMDRDLHHLKICLGHFGGDDEWLKFMESDRDNYSSKLVTSPERGIEFLYNNNNANKIKRLGKPELIWKQVDWYTIICSLMLQYPNVYADISYILYKPEILPLLKHTLQQPVLKDRVLYGTDFYVVRNHKTDKDILAEIMAGLSEEEFDLLARVNPVKFLKLA